MVQCFVYNCSSGKKSCKEKLSMFRAPTDIRKLQKWRETVPQKFRILQSTDRICEKHFESRYVIPRYQQVKGDFYQDLSRPKLTQNAVPTIFPGVDKRRESLAKGICNRLTTEPTFSVIAPKEPESLISLMTKEIASGVEVSDKDFVSICFSCLIGKCSSHSIFIE